MKVYAVMHNRTGWLFPNLTRTTKITPSCYDFDRDLSKQFPPKLFTTRSRAFRLITEWAKGENLGRLHDNDKHFTYKPRNRSADDLSIVTINLEIIPTENFSNV